MGIMDKSAVVTEMRRVYMYSLNTGGRENLAAERATAKEQKSKRAQEYLPESRLVDQF